MVFRKFIPNPTGDLNAVSAAGVVNVRGLDTKHTDLDTYGGPYGCKVGDPSPDLSNGMNPIMGDGGWGVGNRKLQGTMRNGKK